MRSISSVVTVIAFASLLAMPTLFAAKKPGPITYPVTATFRCPTGADCISPDRIDRLQGDAAGPYVGNLATNLGFFLFTNLSYRLDESVGRLLFMDFRQLVVSPACAQTSTCKRTFDTLTISTFDGLLNCVDAAGNPLPNGMLDIPPGGIGQARMKINFSDPAGRSLLWTIRFNPEVYPGSSHVRVTRSSDGNTWWIEATTADRARLVVANMHGNNVTTDEGTFVMPFRLTATR